MDTRLASPPLSTRTTTPSRAAIWTGRGLTGLVVAILLVDGGAKLIPLAPVVEATRELGFSVAVIRPLGFVLAASALLHVAPPTQLVGALLVTAYLGGATATHVLLGTSFWFPVTMGVVLWVAYALRSPQLRELVFSSR